MLKMNIPEDPFIRELLPEFVETWIGDIDSQFDEFISTKNAAELYRLAHTLKGSCFQFGLDDVANMGIELMALAKENNWDKALDYKEPIRKAFVDMKDYLDANPL